MKDVAIGRTPSVMTVAMEQLRLVGLAVRSEALLVCGGLVAFLMVLPLVEEGVAVALDPAEVVYLAIVLALVTPLGVWKGEKLFGESLLWSTPVDHARHARIKVAAGWAWLMAVVLFGLLAIMAFVILVGGTLGVEEVRLLTTEPRAARTGVTGPLQSAAWSTPWWQWTLPFTAATGVYLAVSALVVGFRRPVFWAVGGWLLFLGLGAVWEDGRIALVTGGLDALFSSADLFVGGGSDFGRMTVTLDSGERATTWARLPSFGGWAAATVMWLGLTVGAMWAASARHREK